MSHILVHNYLKQLYSQVYYSTINVLKIDKALDWKLVVKNFHCTMRAHAEMMLSKKLGKMMTEEEEEESCSNSSNGSV